MTTQTSSEATKDLAGRMIAKAKKVTLTREEHEQMLKLPLNEQAAFRRKVAERSK